MRDRISPAKRSPQVATCRAWGLILLIRVFGRRISSGCAFFLVAYAGQQRRGGWADGRKQLHLSAYPPIRPSSLSAPPVCPPIQFVRPSSLSAHPVYPPVRP